MKAITADNILIDGKWLQNKAILIENETIRSVVTPDELDPDITVTNYGEGYLSQGYFDIQVNGGGGVLLNDQPTIDGIKAVAAAHRSFGTTSLLPTLISDEWDVMLRMADATEEAIASNVPGVKGVHFEGPYLNPDRKGVHNDEFIRPAEDKFIDLISDRNLGAVLVTLAPETVSLDFIRALCKTGAIVSAGHTAATYEQSVEAMDAGLTGFTHLYNAMPPLLSREPGVIGAALEGSDGYCGIIVDGHHVHLATLKAAINAKTPDKMMLVTDAMPPVGADDLSFNLGDVEISVTDGRCQTADGTLAGSCISMEGAVRNSCGLLGQSLSESISMASTSPARFMGLDQKMGKIAAGFAAEFVVLSSDGTILNVL